METAIRNRIKFDNELGRDAKDVILFCLGGSKNNPEKIFKDFRGDYATEEIFASIGGNYDFSQEHWEKILDYLDACSPYFDKHLCVLIHSANQNIFAAVPSLLHIKQHAARCSIDDLEALCETFNGTATIRSEIIIERLKTIPATQETAIRLGGMMNRLQYMTEETDLGFAPAIRDYYSKLITSNFVKHTRDEQALDLFANALLSPKSQPQPKPEIKDELTADYINALRELESSDKKSSKLLLGMFSGREYRKFFANAFEQNQETVLKGNEFADDFFDFSKEHAIKKVGALLKERPDFAPLAAKSLKFIISQDEESQHLYHRASEVMLENPQIIPDLLPEFEKQKGLTYSNCFYLILIGRDYPQFAPRCTRIIKRGLRNQAVNSDKIFSTSILGGLITDETIQTPMMNKLAYTFLRDTITDAKEVLLLAEELFQHIHPDPTREPSFWRIMRFIHRNEYLRSSKKDFSKFIGKLQAYKISNKPDISDTLKQRIDKMTAKSPHSRSIYISTLLEESLQYAEHFGRSKKFWADDRRFDDPYLFCQPKEHQKATLNEVERVIIEDKPGFRDRSNVFLYLRRFEHYAIPAVKQRCKEVENALKLPKLYTKLLDYGKNKMLIMDKVKDNVSKYFE